MSTANFKLDMFEGPLDLLLHLISKHKLNIYDIEIALLLEQYLEYMAGLEEEDYEDAADFLEMAARLIYIKTVSLLPKDNEGEELKKELQGSLIEYSLCKMAAARLKEQYANGDIFVRKPAKLPVNKTFTGERDPMDLAKAYMGMSEKARHSKPLKAEMFKPILSKRIVSVTSKIIHVLKMLITQGECFLDSMYEGCTDKSERVAVFLAVLELTKSGRIFLNDDNTRVYMNSASKKKKITSSFDEAEAAANTAAEDETAAQEDESGVKDMIPAGTDTSAMRDMKTYSPDEEEYSPLPYKLYEQPRRTVYKSETKQRGVLPLLKIELAPELQRMVEDSREQVNNAGFTSVETEGSVAVTEDKVNEVNVESVAVAEDKTSEVTAENVVVVEDKTDEISAESVSATEDKMSETTVESVTVPEDKSSEANAESIEVTEDKAPEVTAENVAVVENKADEVTAESVVVVEDKTDEVNAESISVADNKANEVNVESVAVTEDKTNEVTAESVTVPENKANEVNTESIAVTENTTDEITAEVYHFTSCGRVNRFGVRFYWGACGWAEGRLRIR
ncbi:ScpA family protein [uncultured Ruminococcus sp.]|uniref:segregation and condensation protein A n=1 Tax=uncultured Ruminococcus sp. TaxID=165186 RepID=UPI0025E6A215|nr:segregation/condensation protein A [uncultured Ruminococcus sp.]